MNKKKNNIEESFALALKNHQSKNFIAAENQYKKILEINPEHFESVFYLGALSGQLKKFDFAKNLLEKAIQMRPDYINAHSNLGIVLKELGDLPKAVNCFEKVIEIQPKHIIAHNILGSIFTELGKYKEAFIHYKKAILINPNSTLAINNLSILLREINLNDITRIKKTSIRELLLFLFKRKDVDHNDLCSKAILLFRDKYYNSNKINFIINSNTSLLKEKIIKDLLKDELFLLILQKSLITDYFLEKILNKLRYEILSNILDSNINILKENFNFITSLAEQCFFNEYVFIQSNKESKLVIALKKIIEKDQKINDLKIAVLGCYVPLHTCNKITKRLINYKSKKALFNDLINMQVNEPLQEKALINSIKSLGKISNVTSKKVRDQYEKNPYPRWRYIYKNLPVNSQTILKNQIIPNKIKFKNKFYNPDILVAGCGTGKNIFKAANYLNANILGLDLSRTSLAYAKRKIEESGLKNIDFMHADILELKNLERKFDIIECAGVLHHMKDPVRGLKVLLDLLKPHGLLQLGLYSKIARQDIIKAREFIKKNKFKTTLEDIRNCRKKIYNDKDEHLLKKIFYRKDFYSTSTVRDLIFNVQEHRFSLLQISKILKNLNLEFLGFTDTLIKRKYIKFFPEDKNNTSLENWHQFEIDNPDAFLGMYSFCIRKKENVI